MRAVGAIVALAVAGTTVTGCVSAATAPVSPPTSTSPTATSTPTTSPTSTAGGTAATSTPPASTQTPLASATLTPAPTAKPTPRQTPPPTTAPPSRLVTHGSRTENEVALTYDMGGRVGDAVAIMQWLVAHEVHATVFMTGAMADNVNTDAGRTVLGIVQDHPELFTLGNHSYSHPDFRTLTATGIRDQLRRTEAAIAPWCSQDLRPFFRPPNGGYDADMLAAVGVAGYADTVTWDVDTIDWRPVANDPPGPTADQIAAKVLDNARAGSIVLNHLGGYHTYEALPRVVAGLLTAGYQLVTLDELLGP